MSSKNPFGDNPLGDEPGADPVRRLRSAATRIRGLRGQVAHDGLSPSASRTLLDELSTALDACAAALEEAGKD